MESLKKRRTSLTLLGIGVALVVGAIVAANYTPELSRLTSGDNTRSRPAGPPLGPASLLSCGDSNSGLTTYPNRGITLPNLTLPHEEVHPRLDFTESDVRTLRDRAYGKAADPHQIYGRDWRKILTDVTAGQIEGSSSDDINSRKAKAYGFAYVITGSNAFRDIAVKAMASAFRSFDSEDAYVAAQMTNYVQAYDYVAGSLDRGSSEDTAARSGIKRGAQWLADWINGKGSKGTNPRPHNHRSKVALALGLWSLVFSSDESAQEWLTLSVDQINTVYQYMFTKDGVYLDGYGYYWTYQIFQAVPFLYAARNITGVDPFPAMQPVFEWMVRDSSPQGWLMNIEDSWIKTVWTAVVAGPYLSATTRLSRAAKLGNVLQWRFFSQDWKAPRYPNDWTGASNQAYTWPDEIIHIDQSIAETAPDTDGFDFYDQGANTTVMRSDWKYNDPATRWVMFYGAPQSNNHDHCDTMQVLLNAENTVMLTDSGYGPQRFPGRAEWYPPDRHNVVTMDGAGVKDVFANTVNLDGAFAAYSEKLAYYDQTVAGTPGTKSWRRGVLFPAHDYVVIADSLHSPTSQTWESYLQARGSDEQVGGASVWTTPGNVFGASAKLYALTLPAGTQESSGVGRSNLFGAKQVAPDTEPTRYMRSRQQGADGQFLSIAVPRESSASPPAFADLSADGMLAATVSYDGHTDTMIKQLQPAARTAGGLATDGRLGWSRKNGETVRSWQIVDGTHLSLDGKPYLASTVPVSATADLTAQHPVIDINAKPDEQYTFSIAGDHPDAVFGDRVVAGVGEKGLTSFTLTGSGRLMLDVTVPSPSPSSTVSSTPSSTPTASPSVSETPVPSPSPSGVPWPIRSPGPTYTAWLRRDQRTASGMHD